MSKIIYPEKIKEGDTVAITAVSMPANKEKIDIAIKEMHISKLIKPYVILECAMIFIDFLYFFW